MPDNDLILYLWAGEEPLSLPGQKSWLGNFARAVTCCLDTACTKFNRLIRYCATRFPMGAHAPSSSNDAQVRLPGAPFDTSFKAYKTWDFNVRLCSADVKAYQIADSKTHADPNGITSKIRMNEAARIGYRQSGLRSLATAFHRHLPIRLWQLNRQFRVWLSPRAASVFHRATKVQLGFSNEHGGAA